jgi:hypothetical protein
MSNPYPQLTYPGDVTGSEQAQPGHLLGCDEVGRFYEVIDAYFVNPQSLSWPDEHPPECPDCGRDYPHTHVNLQYATPENIKRASAGSVITS